MSEAQATACQRNSLMLLEMSNTLDDCKDTGQHNYRNSLFLDRCPRMRVV